MKPDPFFQRPYQTRGSSSGFRSEGSAQGSVRFSFQPQRTSGGLMRAAQAASAWRWKSAHCFLLHHRGVEWSGEPTAEELQAEWTLSPTHSHALHMQAHSGRIWWQNISWIQKLELRCRGAAARFWSKRKSQISLCSTSCDPDRCWNVLKFKSAAVHDLCRVYLDFHSLPTHFTT